MKFITLATKLIMRILMINPNNYNCNGDNNEGKNFQMAQYVVHTCNATDIELNLESASPITVGY